MPKSVLITGCSAGGIGHALARSFSSRGLTVFAISRTLSPMSDIKDLPGVHLLTLDVADSISIQTAVNSVRSVTGNLDHLVNNAGRGYWLPSLDTDIEEGKKVFDVNFWGILRTTQAFISLLLSPKGNVVNIGSINGYVTMLYSGIYTSSKGAGHLLGEILRMELAPFGVKVLTVVTGSIQTALHDKLPPSKLPLDSLYASLEQKLIDVAKAKDTIVRQKPHSYAEAMVNDVLAGKTGIVWHRNNSSKVRYLRWILPQSIQDHVMTAGSDLDKLGKAK